MLEIHALRKRYGEVQAVDDVSFKVYPGEIYGLLGPNGAGKTTTISIISGLIAPDSGHVKVDGQLFREDPIGARLKMGVVPQEVALYDELSGRENLIYWGKIAGLNRTEVRGRAAEILEGLDLIERGSDPIKTYSGGMKRRINLGCALMHRPKLLLLDEPTVGIDPQARARILEFVRDLTGEGTAILYTTHYLEEAESLCDHIGVIDHGRLLTEGTLDQLQKQIEGDQLFVLDGQFVDTDPGQWNGFSDRFRVIRQSKDQWVVASLTERHPSECLKELLDLPIKLDNVMVKRPSLNDVFLQLTGRELRE